MIGDPFWALLIYVVLAVLIVGGMLIIPGLLGERHSRKPSRRLEEGTGEPYESGIRPTGSAKLRFPIQYYVVAMLFVIFDVEAVYLYAWAAVAQEAGWSGFLVAMVFIVLLMTALVYLWRAGALDWTTSQDTIKVRRRRKEDERRALVA